MAGCCYLRRVSSLVGSALRAIFPFAALAAALAAGPALAQTPESPPAKPEMRQDFCPGLVASDTPRVIPASLRMASLAADQVRLTFIGHSTFLIESARRVTIATDYNDYVRPSIVPDIVTMNRAHSTHYTNRPEASIKHVLRGWREDGAPAGHDVSYQDVHVRSIATNIRDWSGGTMRHGNSIFVFEIGSLCIAHLGHLHHTLTQQQINEIGRVDVVLVPVDGSMTLDLDGMVEVLQALRAPLMVPMHFFSSSTLERFIERVSDQFDIERADTPVVVLSRATLPGKPKLLVLPGR